MADERPSIGRALPWATYLACSWTWCIGMFLPVLLVRDYGVWGFVVFAVPNVVGAAAFGWVLGPAGSSERIVALHGRAITSFSLVTCAFHGFFLGWLALSLPAHVGVTGTVGAATLGGLIGVPLLILTFQTRLPAPAWWVGSSIWVLAFSLLMLGALVVLGLAGTSTAPVLPRSPGDVAWLAPVTVLGFVLCPYLDATFHRARLSQGAGDAKIAFTLGFGALFLVMILFTLAYTGVFLDARAGAAIVCAHIAVQSLFTCGVHAREIHHSALRTMRRPVPLTVVPTAAGMLIGVLAGPTIFRLNPPTDPLARAEVIYRCFMGFYALIFPAYVWLCMIPTRDGHAGTAGPAGTWKLRIFWLTVGVAAPMYWMGFIEGHEIWLGPGVMIVLLARVILPGRRVPAAA